MSKKIIILASQSNSLVNFRYHLIQDFLKSGLVVEALSPEDPYFLATKAKLKQINVSLTPIALRNTSLNLLKDFILCYKLTTYFRKNKPEIAFFYTIKPVIFGSLAAKFTKVPNIYAMVSGLGSVFIGDSFQKRIFQFLIKRLYKWALAGVNKVFFHNNDDADAFLTAGIVKPDQIIVTGGSGVDISYFTPLPYPEQLCFLFVGRLIRDKGINEFIAAAKQIKSEYPQARFLIAGALHHNPSSLTQAELEQLIQQGIIEYLGEVADIRTALQQASVFVLPSYREGLSRAALEALATARAIITTEAPGCREVVKPAVNGFLVPVANAEQLTEAMRQFINNPSLIPVLGRAGRELALSRFAVSTINRVILTAMGIKIGDARE